MEDLVTVMLPTYARCREGYLKRAIESVLAQTHSAFELIVIDDGSKDGSADLIAAFSIIDQRVKHIRFEENVGLPALTTGMSFSAAEGNFVAFIFDDCEFSPDHLQKLLSALKANPDALMAYGQAKACWKCGESQIVGMAYDAVAMQRGDNHIPNVSVMLRRQAVEVVGWYDPHLLLKRFCDWDLWIRIAAKQKPIFIEDVVALEYGTMLSDSLGETVTLAADLMLRYSRTYRDDRLKIENLNAYDAFRVPNELSLSPEDLANFEFIVTEHLLATNNIDEVRRRINLSMDPPAELDVASVQIDYLKRRMKILSAERNDFQYRFPTISADAERKADALQEVDRALQADSARMSAKHLRLETVISEMEQQAQIERLEAANNLARANAHGRALAEAHLNDRAWHADQITAWIDRRRAWSREKRDLLQRIHDGQALQSQLSYFQQLAENLNAQLIELTSAQVEAERNLEQHEANQKQWVSDFSAAHERQFAALGTENEKLTGQIHSLLQSTSWRITQPLRAIRDLVRKVRSRNETHRVEEMVSSLPASQPISIKTSVDEDLRAEEELSAEEVRSNKDEVPQYDDDDTQKLISEISQEQIVAKQNLMGVKFLRAVEWSFKSDLSFQDQKEFVEYTQTAVSSRKYIVAIGDATVSTEMALGIPLRFMAEHLAINYSLYDVGAPPELAELKMADLLVFMRANTQELQSLAVSAANDGIPIIYMTDDDMESLVADEHTTEILTRMAEHFRNTGAVDTINNLAAMSDTTIVFSDALRRKFERIAPTILAPAMSGIEFFDEFPSVQRDVSSLGEMRIGYAGSPTHERDVSIIASTLLRILEEEPSVVIETIGQKMLYLDGHERYRHFNAVKGLREFCALQHSRNWDIGLAPLESTVFNQSKSDNKYRTYGASGVAGVYSNVGSFSHTIQNGRNGLLAENDPDEWFSKIKQLIHERDFRDVIAREAKKDVRRRFGVRRISHLYREVFSEFMSDLKVLVVSYLHLGTVAIDIRRPFKELQNRGQIRYRLRELIDVTEADLIWATVLVVVRAGEPKTVDLLHRAKARKLKVIFSWDDDFFSILPEHSGLYEFYSDPLNIAALEYVLEESDLVKASTKAVADVSRRYTDKVLTAPYAFDLSILPRFLPERDVSRIKIGYFGTPGRGPEFNCVMEALKHICSDHQNVDIEFFGFCPTEWEALPRVTFIPYSDDYEEAIRMLAERQWNIGLGPLALNNLCRAKLPTKYRDYGATRITGIYTRIEPYEAVVKSGENGILVENTMEAWYQALDLLIRSPDLRQKMAQYAFDDVKDNHGLDVALKAWSDAFRLIGIPING